MPQLVDGNSQYLTVQDIPTHLSSLTDFLSEPLSHTLFALLHGGEAHLSYWQSDSVAKHIARAIHHATSPSDAPDFDPLAKE